MAEALRAVRRRSCAPGDSAYCILEIGEYYLQLMSVFGSDTYLIEISSHHYVPSMAKLLGEAEVTFLDEAGFRWPRRTANFSREVAAWDDSDVSQLADFVLGALHVVFGHGSGHSLEVKLHVPIAG